MLRRLPYLHIGKCIYYWESFVFKILNTWEGILLILILINKEYIKHISPCKFSNKADFLRNPVLNSD